MNKQEIPKVGFIYFIDGFTAPKLFDGCWFECLLSEDKIIPTGQKLVQNLGHIKFYQNEIYLPKRFNFFTNK